MICYPENDEKVRYVLGKKGTNNILVIALNPSTATAAKHDGTTDNIEKIAAANGYDGWVLFNLSPQRTADVHRLDVVPDKEHLDRNINTLDAIILRNEFQIKNIWLAWGNNIVHPQFPYLREQALIILERLKKYDLAYCCIKETDKHHPFHPARQGINRYIGSVSEIKLIPFNTNSYLKRLKSKT